MDFAFPRPLGGWGHIFGSLQGDFCPINPPKRGDFPLPRPLRVEDTFWGHFRGFLPNKPRKNGDFPLPHPLRVENTFWGHFGVFCPINPTNEDFSLPTPPGVVPARPQRPKKAEFPPKHRREGGEEGRGGDPTPQSHPSPPRVHKCPRFPNKFPGNIFPLSPFLSPHPIISPGITSRALLVIFFPNFPGLS